MTDLVTLLEPITRFVADLDAADPKKCEAALEARFPSSSPAVKSIRDAAFAALAAGTLCTKGEPGMKFSRVLKPQDSPTGASIDAVYMENAAGPAHTHPNGEFCLCLAEAGAPTFENRAATWIVMPKGSRHVPTVANGKMLILYWLPAGAVAWG